MAGCVFHANAEGSWTQELLEQTQLKSYESEKNYFKILVSDADGDDLSWQIADAIAFLRQNEADLQKLSAIEGMETSLDFGVWQTNHLAQFKYFPPNLLLLAGSLNIGIELSLYLSSGPSEEPTT